jgi:predicted amidohydrolase YtcJ
MSPSVTGHGEADNDDTEDPLTKIGGRRGLSFAARAANLLHATIGTAPVLGEDGQLTSTRQFLHELNRFGLTSVIDAADGQRVEGNPVDDEHAEHETLPLAQ